jgi:hypothetical protein
MTALAELDRIARNVVVPLGATGVRAVVDHQPGDRLVNGSPSGLGSRTRFGAAFTFDGGRRVGQPIALFDRGRDALALVRILEGAEPAPRSAPDHIVPPAVSAQGRVEASSHDGVSPSMPVAVAGPGPVAVIPEPAQVVDGGWHGAVDDLLTCEVCSGPMPTGRHGQERRTCSDACRQRARYRRQAGLPVADADSETRNLTPSRRSDAGSPDPLSLEGVGASSSARPRLRRTAHPAGDPEGHRGDVQLPLLSG